MKLIIVMLLAISCTKDEPFSLCSKVKKFGSCTNGSCAIEFENGERYYYGRQGFTGDEYCRQPSGSIWLPRR